ncbi:MAG: UDP-N-acetylmuramate dehydrogenase [Firmicutes bacterium]|nr:UDP-N-acetylmuramate dehydrogenase [Bacillota bacterium]
MDDGDALKKRFAEICPKVRFDEPLARYTTWRIGGTADVLIEPEDIHQLQAALSVAREHGLPVFTFGRGSNVLVADNGVRGLTIHFGDDFACLTFAGDRMTAQAGRSIVSAANQAIRHGLSGLEFATLIPGSVGGAVAMNAGAHGGEIKDVLTTATVMTPDLEVQTLTAEELQFGYRHSTVRERGYVVLEAAFLLKSGDIQEMQERVRAWSRKRQQTQPLSLPNCGSVFRNPPGDHAARLIEASGLKGLRIGNAAVSDLHANFIVNLGQARATDVQMLIEQVRQVVAERFGVTLIPEVRVVGEGATRG